MSRAHKSKQFKIDIPNELHRRLKIASVMQDTTMANLVMDGLEERLREVEERYGLPSPSVENKTL